MPHVIESLAHHVVNQARRSVLAPGHLLGSVRRELPSAHREPSYSHRIGEILVKAGAITIERHRKTADAKLGQHQTS